MFVPSSPLRCGLFCRPMTSRELRAAFLDWSALTVKDLESDADTLLRARLHQDDSLHGARGDARQVDVTLSELRELRMRLLTDSEDIPARKAWLRWVLTSSQLMLVAHHERMWRVRDRGKLRALDRLRRELSATKREARHDLAEAWAFAIMDAKLGLRCPPLWALVAAEEPWGDAEDMVVEWRRGFVIKSLHRDPRTQAQEEADVCMEEDAVEAQHLADSLQALGASPLVLYRGVLVSKNGSPIPSQETLNSLLPPFPTLFDTE